MQPFITSKTRHKLAVLATLALSATVSTKAAGHEAPAKPFQMAVIVDDAHGRAVVSGKYSTAIEKITAGKRKSSDDFSEQVNLCVAYAKTREIEKARNACDAAIAAMSTAGRFAAVGFIFRRHHRQFAGDFVVVEIADEITVDHREFRV